MCDDVYTTAQNIYLIKVFDSVTHEKYDPGPTPRTRAQEIVCGVGVVRAGAVRNLDCWGWGNWESR